MAANKKCYFCSGSKRLEVHHIDMNRQNNTAKNLLDLCQKCHMKLHHTIYARLKKVGMLLYKAHESNVRQRTIDNAKKYIINILEGLK